MTRFSGIFLPIITPFYENEVDYESYTRLLSFYKQKNISGFIPLGTTGESPCITDDEYRRIIDITLETVDGQLPVIAGIGGNFTDSVIKKIEVFENSGIAGILSVCPYYNRPDQKGLFRHFEKLSMSTDLDIIIYNIPYRTGVNLDNTTLLKLAELHNIKGVKDSCGNMKQSLELIRVKPDDFAVLTGEDHLFYTTLVNGGDGGILASAHLYTQNFIDVVQRIKDNDHLRALETWRQIEPVIPMLFEEPNPAPLKHCLYRLSLIRSSETRAPLGNISSDLKRSLDICLQE